MNRTTLFEKLRNNRSTRITCAFLALSIITELIFPAAAMALTAGPTQPEFTSFEPVATTDMVNDFSGSFTYNIPVLNIPGPDGGGYSMSLAYHSGVSSEEEASWVGFGWTLNPGAINRGKRGYPDEFLGADIINYNKTRPSWSQSATFDFNLEPISQDQTGNKKDKKKDPKSKQKFAVKFKIPQLNAPKGGEDDSDFPVSVSLKHSISYNNYSGFSIATGLDIKGDMANLSLNQSGGQNTLGFSVSPLAILGAISKQKMENGKIINERKWKTGIAKAIGKFVKFKNKVEKYTSIGSIGYKLPTGLGTRTYNTPALAYSVSKNSGVNWNFSGSIQVNPAGPVGFQVGVAGGMNIMVNEGKLNGKAHGYMYSSEANVQFNSGPSYFYDYQIENESTFNKHDKNLGIPYNNADIFSATGNDVIGGFRFHHNSIGSYYPNTSTSVSELRNVSIELGIGQTFQIGTDIGIGKQTTSVEAKWPNSISYQGKEFSSSPPRMRFTGDLAGEIDYDSNYDKLLYATINFDGTHYLDLTNYNLNLDTTKVHSSIYPEYVFGEQQSAASNYSLIAGIKITSKDGGKSNYLQPVYTKNEKQLTIGLGVNQDGRHLVTSPLYINNPMDNQTVVGQTIDQKYASTYLLTSKTTFNYVDVTNNGPSDDDFGGWTKFSYRRVWGDSTGWYRYRAPYNGLNYNSGRMLDDDDQTGSMSCGEKEVSFLKCIETKSHLAFFVTNKVTTANFTANFPISTYPYLYDASGFPVASVTTAIEGSGTDRYDGLDAEAINAAGEDPAAESLVAKGTKKMEKLERIVLFAKSDLSHPLSTTFFEYDYSLCQGIPNTAAPANAPDKDKGKLTLKRVWTESNGVNRSLIAPYQFHYEYFKNYPASITSKYVWAADYNTLPSNDANQNPAYHPEELDAWGFYQEDGEKRFEKMQTWLSQKSTTNNTTFDPAAWQLKRIQLPSGGEIHIQYEQKDYSYVQDKIPMAMVSLLTNGTTDGYKSDESIFQVNLEDVGVQSADVQHYVNTLRNYFINHKNKLYFKVLYNYSQDDTPTLHAKTRKYEYVTGYTTVNEITKTGNDVYLHLGERKNINDAGKKDKTLPRYVCYQELATNGGQNLGLNAGSYKNLDLTTQAYKSNPDLKTEARERVIDNTLNMFRDWVYGNIKNIRRTDACKVLNHELSYLKLPVFHAKKGGGIRVKRLITYDEGIAGEKGDASVFGVEYFYENENGASSGVATNEPVSIRQENALIGFIERKKQKWIHKIQNGRDTKQFEGFLGENLLPAAEVVHSRIVVKNIRDGLSTSGYTITRYHTSKDYPMEVEFSDISKKNDTYKKMNLNLPLGMFNIKTNRAWVTQGYLFKLNDMHGKIASKTTYPGIYDPLAFNTPPATNSNKYNKTTGLRPIGNVFYANPSEVKKSTEPAYTSKTIYAYSAPGQKITSLLYDGVNGKMSKAMLKPGTEEDITIFTSNVHEKSTNFSIELDINLTLPVVFSVSFGASFSLTDNLLCQHVTSKAVHQKSYLLSTTTINDGVIQTTENLAFDKYTGDPVLTRTFDGYMAPQEKIYTANSTAKKHQGYYYSLNVPAAWVYPQLAPITYSTGNTNQLTLMAGNVVTYSASALYDALVSPQATTTSWMPSTNPLTNVVNATATTYTNGWFNAGMSADYPGLQNTTALASANKYFYPQQTYSYRALATDANSPGVKIYQGGLASGAFNFFNWNNPTTPSSEWYSDSRITKYSPYGYPVEEEDALAIKSSAKFGYNNTLPVIVAQNATLDETRFMDFEYGTFNPSFISKTNAHTGMSSYIHSSDPNYVFVNSYPIDIQKGITIKLWLKSVLSTVPGNIFYGRKNPNPLLKANIGGEKFAFKAIASTGEWTLYSVDIQNYNSLASGVYNIKLGYNLTQNEMVFVDDFRVQPTEASMNCSVYNGDNKLTAQFDDQHFAVFYEYNNRGQLVRKSIETERGRKTLQEQQYNTPLIAR